MFDFPDFYRRMVASVPDDAKLAEVGFANGASAIFLAETLLNADKEFKLHLVDNLDYGGTEQLLTVVQNLCRAKVVDRCVVLPKDSLNAACAYPDQLFDLVFIDASHKYELTKADIRLWFQKVKHGGILAGHDYNIGEGAEVKQAVDELILSADLEIVKTDKGCGVWMMRRQPETKLKT